MYRPLILAVAAVLVSSPALANAPLHVKRTVPGTFDAAAGEVCDFAYHQESQTTQNIIRFRDDAGNITGAVRVEETWVLHQNVETGYTLTEVDHLSIHWSYDSGEFVLVGNGWHLRDEDGRLVLAKAGRWVEDLYTGEFLGETPNAGYDFAAQICPALGGAPAP